MSTSNRITKVAFVGAGGNSGRYMVEALLKTGQHTITALTRAGSTSTIPEGVKSVKVDYDKHDELVAALRGHDALVITLSALGPQDTQQKLVKAAGDAAVPWVLPNEWSPLTDDEGVNKDIPIFASKQAFREAMRAQGNVSFIGVVTGYWYEWSLAIPSGFGIDWKNKEVTFFDDGETKLTTSTWAQVARAVAALLSLPVKPEGGDSQQCLEHYRNQLVNIGSFTISQKELFESALRVTGTKRDDWKISYEPSRERFEKAVAGLQAAFQTGDVPLIQRWMYSRVFFPEQEVGNYEKKRGLINDVLSLPKEDLDVATAAALKRSQDLFKH